jgi:hypothetical protein
MVNGKLNVVEVRMSQCKKFYDVLVQTSHGLKILVFKPSMAGPWKFGNTVGELVEEVTLSGWFGTVNRALLRIKCGVEAILSLGRTAKRSVWLEIEPLEDGVMYDASPPIVLAGWFKSLAECMVQVCGEAVILPNARAA